MSQRLLTAAAFAVFALPVASAHGQVHYGLAAGLSEPRADFGKAVDAGYHVTGLVTVSAPLAPVGLRIEGSFSDFQYKSSTGSTSAKARLLTGTANAVFSSPGIMGPYLVGGVGIYHASAVCSGCSSSTTKGGLNAGAGFKFGLSGFSAFVEARYHYVPGAMNATTAGIKSSTQYIPVSFGVTF